MTCTPPSIVSLETVQTVDLHCFSHAEPLNQLLLLLVPPFFVVVGVVVGQVVHSKGFVHGDIRTSTVFLGPPKEPERLIFTDVFGPVDVYKQLRRSEFRAAR